MSCSSLLSLLLDCIFSISNWRRLLLPLNSITVPSGPSHRCGLSRKSRADIIVTFVRAVILSQQTACTRNTRGTLRRILGLARARTNKRTHAHAEILGGRRLAGGNGAASAPRCFRTGTLGGCERDYNDDDDGMVAVRGGLRVRASGRGGPKDWMLVPRVQPIGRSPSGPGGACCPTTRPPPTQRTGASARRRWRGRDRFDAHRPVARTGPPPTTPRVRGAARRRRRRRSAASAPTSG